MEIDDLIRIARARWRVIAAYLLACVALCGAYLYITPAQYTSTAKVYVSLDAGSTSYPDAATYTLTQQVQAYATLVTNQLVTSQVSQALNLNPSTNLAPKLSATVDSVFFLDVAAVDTNQAFAQQLAQTAAAKLAATISRLQKNTHAQVTDPATFPQAPTSPTVFLDLVVATSIGLLLGLSAALIRERLDKTIRTDKQVELATGAPVLASVILDPQATRKPLLSDIGEFASRAEALRLLRTNLQFVDLDNPPRVFVITSAVAAEGKTQITTNLAISMARAGLRTLLVDGDLRRPAAANLLGLDSNVGLTTVLTGQVDLSRAIQIHRESGLHLLASGKRPPNPTEVLQTQATRDLIDALRQAYDAVIIDAPPLLPVADPAVLASAADGAIVVVRHGSTTMQQLEVAAGRLSSVGARIFGVVLNMVPRPDPGAYAYYMEYAPLATPPVKEAKDAKEPKGAKEVKDIKVVKEAGDAKD